MSTFSKQQLHNLRNNIPIANLINDVLSLKSIFNGVWRFQCPLCQQFNTATKENTNLARCFSCQRNFNTIEITIYSKKWNFKQSVGFLLPYLSKFNKNRNTTLITNRQQIQLDPLAGKRMNPEKAMLEIKKMKELLIKH